MTIPCNVMLTSSRTVGQTNFFLFCIVTRLTIDAVGAVSFASWLISLLYKDKHLMYVYLIMALSQCPIIRQGGVNKLDLLHRVLGIHNRRALVRTVQLHVNRGHFKQETCGRVHLWSIFSQPTGNGDLKHL